MLAVTLPLPRREKLVRGRSHSIPVCHLHAYPDLHRWQSLVNWHAAGTTRHRSRRDPTGFVSRGQQARKAADVYDELECEEPENQTKRNAEERRERLARDPEV